MKSSIAVVIAALLATGTAFAHNAQPTAKKAPTQIAQTSGGGASSGAGTATGAAGAGMSTGTMIAIGAGAAAIVAATRNNETTTHH